MSGRISCFDLPRLRDGLLVLSLLAATTLSAAPAATDRDARQLRLSPRERAMAGEWAIATEGTSGKFQPASAFSQKGMPLAYDAAKRAFVGSPFGWPIVDSSLTAAKPGGAVSFSTRYEMGGTRYGISWSGKLSDQGTRIEGAFSCMVGKGTFVAEKKPRSAGDLFADGLPEEARGFAGLITGEVVELAKDAAVVKITKANAAAARSTAARPAKMVGCELVIAVPAKPDAAAPAESLRTLIAGLALGATESFDVAEQGGALQLVGLTENQQKRLAAAAK